MPVSELRLIKRCVEFVPIDEAKNVPHSQAVWSLVGCLLTCLPAEGQTDPKKAGEQCEYLNLKTLHQSLKKSKI